MALMSLETVTEIRKVAADYVQRERTRPEEMTRAAEAAAGDRRKPTRAAKPRSRNA